MPQYTINKTYNYIEDGEDFFNRYLNINDSVKYYDILGIRNPTIYGAGLNDRNQLLNVSSNIPLPFVSNWVGLTPCLTTSFNAKV